MASRTTEQAVNVNEVSRVSTGTVIKGEISSPNDIRIDGNFEGKVLSKGKVVVGEKAVITGDIVCENADFYGRMCGNFYVKDTLSLKNTSSVEGNLNVRRLSVDLDARFDGVCRMIDEQEFRRLSKDLSGDSDASEEVPAPADASATEPTSC